MRIVRLALAGIVVQAVCLAFFAFVSSTRAAAIGKPIAYGLACVGILFIMWRAVAGRSGWMSLSLLPILLALGYIVAWDIVGVVWFKGLLWDAYAPGWDHVWLEFDIAWLLAGVYGIAIAMFFGVHRMLTRGTRTTS